MAGHKPLARVLAIVVYPLALLRPLRRLRPFRRFRYGDFRTLLCGIDGDFADFSEETHNGPIYHSWRIPSPKSVAAVRESVPARPVVLISRSYSGDTVNH